MNMIDKIHKEIIRRSNEFEEKTRGTKEEYNLYESHVKYVYNYALKLCEDKDVDKEVVKLSALLHDIAMTDINLGRENHAFNGSKIAYNLLLDKGYPKDKCEFVSKCILNHSSKRKKYRTTNEEQILVDADGLSHFDSIKSIYSLASNVYELNDEESVKFVQDKLKKDYLELTEELKPLINDKYEKIMNAKTKDELFDKILKK